MVLAYEEVIEDVYENIEKVGTEKLIVTGKKGNYVAYFFDNQSVIGVGRTAVQALTHLEDNLHNRE